MLREFKLQEIQHVENGAVAIMFDKLLAQAVRDCNDRPGHEAVREISLMVKVKPILHSSGALDHVKGVVILKGKTPAHETPEIHFDVRHKGGSMVLAWNDMAEDDPKQRTIDELEGD